MGAWKADLKVVRASPTLDPGVTDADWAADDGSTAVGAAELTISVLSDGRVTGTLRGALGECDVSGQTDGAAIRGVLAPHGAGAPVSMSGTLFAQLVGDRLEGELRASSSDARIVRSADVDLGRQ